MLALPLRPVPPKIDFVALINQSLPALWHHKLKDYGFKVVHQGRAGLEQYKRVLKLWPHAIALRHQAFFHEPRLWRYRANALKGDDSFVAQCAECPDNEVQPADRFPPGTVARSCNAWGDGAKGPWPHHVEFHLPPTMMASRVPEKCVERYAPMIKLWMALAYSSSVARARVVLAAFLRGQFNDENSVLFAIVSAALKFDLGEVDEKFYVNLVDLTRESLPQMHPNHFARFGWLTPYMKQPAPDRRDPTLSAWLAKQLHAEWLENQDYCAGLVNDEQRDLARYVRVGPTPANKSRILYAVVTHSKVHEERVLPLMRTWLSRVDHLVVLSDKADERIGTVVFPFDGPQTYDNMWNVFKGVYHYLYPHYFATGDFDWLVLLTDDVFGIPENVEALVREPDVVAMHARGDAVFMGRLFNAAFPDPTGDIAAYASGGPMRLMNRVAMDKLYAQLGNEWCAEEGHVAYADDVSGARCLALAGVLPVDARDRTGADRFHAFPPDMALYEGDLQAHPLWRVHAKWYQHYIYPQADALPAGAPMTPAAMRTGPRFVSVDSVCFHLYLKPFSPPSHGPTLLYRLHLIAYGECQARRRAEL